DLSKVRAGRIEVHSAAAASTPIRMVEDVEGFGAELESETFVHRDRLKQPHVPVPESGLIDQVTDTLCVEGPVCRRAEDRRAVRIGCREPLTTGSEFTDDLRLAIDDQVLAIHAAAEV